MSGDLKTLAEALVRACRTGCEAEGSARLGDLVGALPELIQARAEHLDLQALQTVATEMLAAQERGDLLWLADLVQYELLPLLQID